jgi:hypothetical protein
MRDVNDRLRDHLDAEAPPIDIDLLARALVAEGRTDDMPVTTLKPDHDAPAHVRRRWRIALAFAAALIVTIAAVGAVAWLGGGSDGPAAEPTIPSPRPLTTETPPTTVDVTSTPPMTSEASLPAQAILVTLDPGVALAWAQQAVTVGLDGEIRVLYQRDDTTVALARCEDATCAEPVITTLLDNGDPLGWVIGTARSEGPVFWLGAGAGDAFSSLVICVDDACADRELITLRGAADAPGTPVVTTTSDDIPLVGYMNGVYPSDVITFRCMEPTCAEDFSNWVTWSSLADQFVGKAAIAQAEGPPVIAVAGEESLYFGSCRQDECRPNSETLSGFASMVEVPVAAGIFRGPELMLRPDGAPLAVVFLENGLAEDIVAISCDTVECLTPVVTTLGTTLDSFTEWDTVLGPDGLLRVAWTDQGTLWLASCTDEMCTAFDLVEVNHPARDIAIEIGSRGFPILATSSPDRGLELLVCADAQCTYAPPEVP